MAETRIKTDKLKVGLLALQILLPLAGYYTLQVGRLGMTWGVAALFMVSMAVLIWVG